MTTRTVGPRVVDLDGSWGTYDAWTRLADCLDAPPELFDSTEDGHVPAVVRLLCGSCPVRPACLAHALAFREWGIWAGLSEAERAQVRQRRWRYGQPIPDIVPLPALSEERIQWAVAERREQLAADPSAPVSQEWALESFVAALKWGTGEAARRFECSTETLYRAWDRLELGRPREARARRSA